LSVVALGLALGAAGATAVESAERVAVGQQAPVFALADTAGKVHRLAEYTEYQRLVLVFFRGAW
jgi:hypothetical protein